MITFWDHLLHILKDIKDGSTDVYVSYTLDNYITVTGIIGGKVQNRSGYLINASFNVQNGENLSEKLLICDAENGNIIEDECKEYKYIYEESGENAEKIYFDDDNGKWFLYKGGVKKILEHEAYGLLDKNAEMYTIEALAFTDWIQENLKDITIGDLVLEGADDEHGVRGRNKDSVYGYGSTNIKIFDSSENNFENPDSNFNKHKNDMIRLSIKENLSNAIANYSLHATNTTAAFQMPALTENEWEQVTKNISIITFVQGMPVGFKTYNNYAIINNTRNKDFVNQDAIVFVDSSDTNSEYHMIDCPYLTGTNLQGYRKIDFEPSSVQVIVSTTDASGQTTSHKENKYYYSHTNLPCYYCIVSRNYTSTDGSEITNNKDARTKALNTALARERRLLHIAESRLDEI